ncbi:MAG: neutral zinc metallopeptidase [Hyphomicrobiales bacterium]
MRLDDEQASRNIEDRRGQGGPGGFGMPGGGGMIGSAIPIFALRQFGIWGLLIVLLLMWLFGFFGSSQQPQVGFDNSGGQQTQATDQMKEFVAKVLGTTERTWTNVFAQQGKTYTPPKLVLFSGYVQSACGQASAAMGPFYCPLDQKVYLDMSFYRDMQNKLGAPGDFARAYVIAHEIGHHVQNLLGIANKVTQARMRAPEAVANQLSVLMELQADCFAGVWAHDNAKLLEQGDIEEGLNAASAIGDDRLQKRSQGYAVPDSFTHGSSEQRVRWFKRGIETGDMRSCDTFGANQI